MRSKGVLKMHDHKILWLRYLMFVSLLALTTACASNGNSSLNATADRTGGGSIDSSQALNEIAGLEADLDPTICEWSAGIGTKIQKKVCMKKSQWDRYNGKGSEITSKLQQRGSLQGSSGEVIP